MGAAPPTPHEPQNRKTVLDAARALAQRIKRR